MHDRLQKSQLHLNDILQTYNQTKVKGLLSKNNHMAEIKYIDNDVTLW